MYTKLLDGEIEDTDLEQLRELLAVLDSHFAQYTEKRNQAAPPEQNVYWDRLSYVAGLGFVMCQQYINDTWRSAGLDFKTAMAIPPLYETELSVVRVINAAANYWKHYVEDVDFPKGTLREETMKVIQQLNQDIESGCLMEVFLEHLVGLQDQPFAKLSDLLVQWRGQVIATANREI